MSRVNSMHKKDLDLSPGLNSGEIICISEDENVTKYVTFFRDWVSINAKSFKNQVLKCFLLFHTVDQLSLQIEEFSGWSPMTF